MKYEELKLSPEILKAVQKMGFSEMTEIQEKAIPILMENREVIAKAPTGTGKTCSFGIPIIESIDLEQNFPQALVLCPTRELCTQLRDDFRKLAPVSYTHLCRICCGVLFGRRPAENYGRL